MTGDTGTVEVDDPGGPDEGFKLPEPEDDDWDWEPRVVAGFSTWADSESGKKEVGFFSSVNGRFIHTFINL